jgi:hypothetical protein
MAEAKRSIQQIAAIRITTAANVLAQLRARDAIKDQLRKQGLKVSHYAARDVTAMACEYLSQHRSELLSSAIETIKRWTLAGESGKRAQRALAQAQCAELRTNAEAKEHCSDKQISVQMLGAE